MIIILLFSSVSLYYIASFTQQHWILKTACILSFLLSIIIVLTFKVSEYIVRQACNLESTDGILAMSPPHKGKTLAPDVIDAVKQYYTESENTRMLPGMHDRVSIGRKIYEQKCLILSTLKDFFFHFKEDHPDMKVGFSKFCSLRPKWCVSAGASETHSVCVCTIHQNVKLMYHAAQIEENYRELIEMAVCSSENHDCMLHKCEICTGVNVIAEMLQEKFEDLNEQIEFNQWVSVDRTMMITQCLPVHSFISLLTNKVSDLVSHHFIAHAQSSYLKQRKLELSLGTAIILMDFSENYSFKIQDEAQGYHWTHSCCTDVT